MKESGHIVYNIQCKKIHCRSWMVQLIMLLNALLSLTAAPAVMNITHNKVEVVCQASNICRIPNTDMHNINKCTSCAMDCVCVYWYIQCNPLTHFAAIMLLVHRSHKVHTLYIISRTTFISLTFTYLMKAIMVLDISLKLILIPE
jgi:hypothetical protein